MRAADIMTPDVIRTTPETQLGELIRLMLDHHVSALPIVEAGSIVGIVSEGDLVRCVEIGTERSMSRWLELVTSTGRLAAGYTKTHGRKAREIMTRDVISVAARGGLSVFRGRAMATWWGSSVGAIYCRCWRRLSVRPATMDDRTIRTAFYAELRRLAWAAPGMINAVVSERVMHLWGIVPDEVEGEAILVVAENIPGVQAVEDHLEWPQSIDPLERPNWPTPLPP